MVLFHYRDFIRVLDTFPKLEQRKFWFLYNWGTTVPTYNLIKKKGDFFMYVFDKYYEKTRHGDYEGFDGTQKLKSNFIKLMRTFGFELDTHNNQVELIKFYRLLVEKGNWELPKKK